MRAGTHRSLIVLLTIVSNVAACAGSGATTGPSSTRAAPIVAPTAIPAGATPALAPTLAPTPTLAPAPVSTPPPASDVYVVVAGDTLWEIAQRSDRTGDELLAANPQIMDRSLIRVGDNIAIPSDDVQALWNATVNLPALPVPAADGTSLPPGCVEGRVTFVDGHGFPPGAEREWYDSTWIEDVVRADVDHDDATDVVALIKCRLGEGSFGRVVAFRPRPDGTFWTIRQRCPPCGCGCRCLRVHATRPECSAPARIRWNADLVRQCPTGGRACDRERQAGPADAP